MSDWGKVLPPFAVVEVTCEVTESASVMSCVVCVSCDFVLAVLDSSIVVVTGPLVVIAAEWFSRKVGRVVGPVIGLVVVVVVGLVVGPAVGPFVGPFVAPFVNPVFGLVVGLVVGLAVVRGLISHCNEKFAL